MKWVWHLYRPVHVIKVIRFSSINFSFIWDILVFLFHSRLLSASGVSTPCLHLLLPPYHPCCTTPLSNCLHFLMCIYAWIFPHVLCQIVRLPNSSVLHILSVIPIVISSVLTSTALWLLILYLCLWYQLPDLCLPVDNELCLALDNLSNTSTCPLTTILVLPLKACL